jgi:hypothetical protein
MKHNAFEIPALGDKALSMRDENGRPIDLVEFVKARVNEHIEASRSMSSSKEWTKYMREVMDGAQVVFAAWGLDDFEIEIVKRARYLAAIQNSGTGYSLSAEAVPCVDKDMAESISVLYGDGSLNTNLH